MAMDRTDRWPGAFHNRAGAVADRTQPYHQATVPGHRR